MEKLGARSVKQLIQRVHSRTVVELCLGFSLECALYARHGTWAEVLRLKWSTAIVQTKQTSRQARSCNRLAAQTGGELDKGLRRFLTHEWRHLEEVRVRLKCSKHDCQMRCRRLQVERQMK